MSYRILLHSIIFTNVESQDSKDRTWTPLLVGITFEEEHVGMEQLFQLSLKNTIWHITLAPYN
jgi:hypothetical protein